MTETVSDERLQLAAQRLAAIEEMSSLPYLGFWDDSEVAATAIGELLAIRAERDGWRKVAERLAINNRATVAEARAEAAETALITPPQNTDEEAVAELVELLNEIADIDENDGGNPSVITATRKAASALSAIKAERDCETARADSNFANIATIQRHLDEATKRAEAAEAERDALLADSTDKAQAWDAIAEKNATIAALKSDLTRYIDIATKEATEAVSLRAELDHMTKSGIIEVSIRNPSVADYMRHWEGRAEKAEAERDALAKALEDIDAKAVLGMCHGLTADDDCCHIHAIASRALQGDAK